jgi:hypothetical protein
VAFWQLNCLIHFLILFVISISLSSGNDAFKIDLSFHEFNPLHDNVIAAEELLILRNELLYKLWRFHSELLWEVITQDLNANITYKLLSHDQAVYILVVETRLEDEEVD